jgi:hypothetical protein
VLLANSEQLPTKSAGYKVIFIVGHVVRLVTIR